MQMIVLFAFASILSLASGDEPLLLRLAAPWLGVCAGAYLLGSAGLAWMASQYGLRCLAKEGQPLGQILRRHHVAVVFAQLWVLLGLIALVSAGLCHQLRLVPWVGNVPMFGEAVAVGLLFLACLIHWRIGYRFDRELRGQVEQELMLAGQPVRAGWSPSQHMDFNIRFHFLFVAIPLGLIVVLRELLWALLVRVVPPEALFWPNLAISALVVGGVFFLSPPLLIRVWRTRRLPDGELRARLERLAKSIGIRFRDILIWDTFGVVVNAAVMGMHRRVRYVMISDAMLEQMDDRQIVAVFGHEAGHVVHHHMGYFLVFAVGAMLACLSFTAGVGWLMESNRYHEELKEILLLVVTAVVWGGAFGWLSRRFERQADVFGAWCAGVDAQAYGATTQPVTDLALGTQWFISALENVARLNGLARDARNWRHGSIASRVAFLYNWCFNGYSRSAYDQIVRTIKLAAWAFLAAGLIGMFLTWSAWT